MNLSTGLARLTYKQVFTPEESDWLYERFQEIEDARWVKRSQMHGHRTLAETTCSYYSCLNKAIPEPIMAFLQDKNPCKDRNLQEVVINKYYPGDWIPMHRDNHFYRSFVLVPVQSLGDGVEIEDKWFEDNKGLGLDFDGTSHKHRVLEVRRLRFTLLYLYE